MQKRRSDGEDNYRTIKVIGKGSYGQAYLVKHKQSKEYFVMKQIKVPDSSHFSKLIVEVEALMKCGRGHPNVCRYRSSFVSQSGFLCLVMDYYAGGDLHGMIRKRKKHYKTRGFFSEEDVLHIFVQLCLGVKHVHDRRILHRDIKSQNVFLQPSRHGPVVKLGDFGIAKVLGSTDDLASTRIGTPYYLSPEICRGKQYNHKSDIWSLGCILYELCSLRHAFDADNISLLAMRICQGKYAPIPRKYSTSMKRLVASLLAMVADQRPSINEILQQPFIQGKIQDHLSKSMAMKEFPAPAPQPHTQVQPRVVGHPKLSHPQLRRVSSQSPPTPTTGHKKMKTKLKKKKDSNNNKPSRAPLHGRPTSARHGRVTIRRKAARKLPKHLLVAKPPVPCREEGEGEEEGGKKEPTADEKKQLATESEGGGHNTKRDNVIPTAANDVEATAVLEEFSKILHCPQREYDRQAKAFIKENIRMYSINHDRKKIITKNNNDHEDNDDSSPSTTTTTTAAAAAAGRGAGGGAGKQHNSDSNRVGKFKFRNVTLHLSTSPRDTLSYRMESLRLFLEKAIGVACMLRVYSLLNNDESVTDTATQIKASIEPSKLDYVALIQQLVVAEHVQFH